MAMKKYLYGTGLSAYLEIKLDPMLLTKELYYQHPLHNNPNYLSNI